MGGLGYDSWSSLSVDLVEGDGAFVWRKMAVDRILGRAGAGIELVTPLAQRTLHTIGSAPPHRVCWSEKLLASCGY